MALLTGPQVLSLSAHTAPRQSEPIALACCILTVLSYRFYKQIGRGDRAFTYQTVQYGCSIVAVLIAQILYDRIGRRPILIAGTALQTLFMLLVAGLGTKAHKTTSDTQGVVASLILFYPVSRFGMGNCSYLISAEMGGVDMRKKLLASVMVYRFRSS